MLWGGYCSSKRMFLINSRKPFAIVWHMCCTSFLFYISCENPPCQKNTAAHILRLNMSLNLPYHRLITIASFNITWWYNLSPENEESAFNRGKSLFLLLWEGKDLYMLQQLLQTYSLTVAHQTWVIYSSCWTETN